MFSSRSNCRNASWKKYSKLRNNGISCRILFPHYFKVFEGFPRQKDGYVTLTDKPGLGLDLNEKEILKHPPYKSTDAKGGANKTI